MVELARWLSDDTPELNRRIAVRALTDCGICENPLGSNRSGVIDSYNAGVGAPLGSYWCAAAVSAWWRESGAENPPTGAASCDVWRSWAKKTGRWATSPVAGAAVVYGTLEDASHIGVVVRLKPILLSVEGNTTLGGEFSRNGVAVDLKAVNAGRVLGYVWPTPNG